MCAALRARFWLFYFHWYFSGEVGGEGGGGLVPADLMDIMRLLNLLICVYRGMVSVSDLRLSSSGPRVCVCVCVLLSTCWVSGVVCQT